MKNRSILNIKKETSFEDALERIYTKAYDDAGCMIWTGGKTSSGYGRVVVDGKATTIRRMLAEKKLGRPLRNDEFAASTCNCKQCVSGDHIRVVTLSQRRKESWETGQYNNQVRGAKIAAKKRAAGKLSIDIVEKARKDQRPSHIVADEIGCSSSMVRSFRAHQTWKDYSTPFAGLGSR